MMRGILKAVGLLVFLMAAYEMAWGEGENMQVYAVFLALIAIMLYFTRRIARKEHAMVAQAMSDINNLKGILIDVRTEDEWRVSHAQGALLHPMEKLEAGDYPTTIERSQRLYLYCQSGNRSAQAMKMFKNAGYKHVVNIGGLKDWERGGGEVVKSE